MSLLDENSSLYDLLRLKIRYLNELKTEKEIKYLDELKVKDSKGLELKKLK